MGDAVRTSPSDTQELAQSEKTILAGLVMGVLALGPRILAGYVSGSITLITDAIRSGSETLSHLSSWLTLRKLRKGRDAVFEYGLGKMESVASFLIVEVMLVCAALMAFVSVSRLIHPQPVERLGLGAVVVMVLSVSNLFLWRRSHRLAESGHSPLMKSHSSLVRNKFFANCCVLASLLVGMAGRHIPQSVYVDPLTSLLLCGFIACSAYRILTTSLSDLLDRTLDESRQLVIVRLLSDFFQEYIQFHGVRSRRAGKQVFIEIYLEFDGQKTMAEAGRIIESMAGALERRISGSQVTIVPCTKPPRSLEQ